MRPRLKTRTCTCATRRPTQRQSSKAIPKTQVSTSNLVIKQPVCHLRHLEAQSQGASGFAMLMDEMLAACDGSARSGQQAPTRTRMVKAEDDP